MRWQVAISKFNGDRRLLRDVLAGLSAGLVEEDGHLFLTSAAFEALDESGAVRERATPIESAINGASYGDLADRLRLTLGSLVVEQKADGPRREHHVIRVDVVEMRNTCHAVGVVEGASATLPEDERKRIEAELREREYQRSLRVALSRAKSAYQDDQARKVQQLLRGGLDVPTLWHIFELIQDDMGGAVKGLAPVNQLERFERSMNHPAALGDQARHAVSNKEPPPNPMRLEEARQFIQNLAARWMEHKAGLNGGK